MDDIVSELIYFLVWPLPETPMGCLCNCIADFTSVSATAAAAVLASATEVKDGMLSRDTRGVSTPPSCCSTF